MSPMAISRIALLATALSLVPVGMVSAQTAAPDAATRQGQGRPPGPGPARATETARDERPAELRPLPADRTTTHKLQIGGKTLEFTATAGTIRLADAQSGRGIADIAFIAYQLPQADKKTRPVTFAFNGGPGYASGWLNLGALGPWRLRMDPDAAFPSADPTLVDNTESWLEFTDLVFLDPAGTGYSRVLGGDDVRKRLWGVEGDINSLATTIRRWVEANDRMQSPKYLAGESYGGFRAPKIAHELTTDQGVSVNGMVLISPVLDFRRFNARSNLLTYVAGLPSMAATARETKGPVDRAKLRDVEDYARGEFLTDLMRGVKDVGAQARLTQRVAELTGLDASFVARRKGRISASMFASELGRNVGKVASAYDGSVLGLDPFPGSERSNADDQMRLGLHAPITQAMVDLYRNRLGWVVENGRYQFMSEQASRQWDWGNRQQEAVGDLSRTLALDPRLRVLIAHGLTDLVTPYFETQMVLDQMPEIGAPERLRFDVFTGGHMFYARDDSRKRFRDDVRSMMVAP
jgi:carboxypeptidase C (cathepsin A)